MQTGTGTCPMCAHIWFQWSYHQLFKFRVFFSHAFSIQCNIEFDRSYGKNKVGLKFQHIVSTLFGCNVLSGCSIFGCWLKFMGILWKIVMLFFSIQYWAGIRVTYAIGSGTVATSSAATAVFVVAATGFFLFQIYLVIIPKFLICSANINHHR